MKKEFEDIEFHGDLTVKQGFNADKPLNEIKKYVAKITQSTTEDPVATVWVNELGGTLVWARAGAGSYTAILTGAFAGNVLAIAVQDFWATGNVANGFRQNISKNNSDGLIIKQYNNTLTPSDSFTMYVEITVYPA